MNKKFKIDLLEFVMSVSSAIDLVNPAVGEHHKKVTYLAYCLGERLGLDKEEMRDLVIASLLHDVGALSIEEWNKSLDFDYSMSHVLHADIGYLFLKDFTHFTDIAGVVRDHHMPWNSGRGAENNGEPVSILSHIIHLADRVTILIDRDVYILRQTKDLLKKIEKSGPAMFVPEHIDAFREVCSIESLWLDLSCSSLESVVLEKVSLEPFEVDMDGLENLARMFSRMIDFKSSYTSTHTMGVSASAEALARCFGFGGDELQSARIAGFLHDIGKLVVPSELLDKPAKLTDEEFAIIKSHTYYTREIAGRIPGLESIVDWACMHHENMNGNGYPFHLNEKSIPLGAKILAVADVYTALAEDRPYRAGMTRAQIVDLLGEMVDASKLDKVSVESLISNYDDIRSARDSAQKIAAEDYQRFSEEERQLRQSAAVTDS